jgi:hypothetical protein
VQADFFTRVSLNERHDFFYPAIHARTKYPTTIGRSIIMSRGVETFRRPA